MCVFRYIWGECLRVRAFKNIFMDDMLSVDVWVAHFYKHHWLCWTSDSEATHIQQESPSIHELGHRELNPEISLSNEDGFFILKLTRMVLVSKYLWIDALLDTQETYQAFHHKIYRAPRFVGWCTVIFVLGNNVRKRRACTRRIEHTHINSQLWLKLIEQYLFNGSVR